MPDKDLSKGDDKLAITRNNLLPEKNLLPNESYIQLLQGVITMLKAKIQEANQEMTKSPRLRSVLQSAVKQWEALIAQFEAILDAMIAGEGNVTDAPMNPAFDFSGKGVAPIDLPNLIDKLKSYTLPSDSKGGLETNVADIIKGILEGFSKGEPINAPPKSYEPEPHPRLTEGEKAAETAKAKKRFKSPP